MPACATDIDSRAIGTEHSTVLLKYWHTLRYLRPVQSTAGCGFGCTARGQMNVRHRGFGSRPGDRVAPVARPESMLGPETFRFLNQTQPAVGPGAWNDPAREKLWLYNLHYFDDLNAVEEPARVGLAPRLVDSLGGGESTRYG